MKHFFFVLRYSVVLSILEPALESVQLSVTNSRNNVLFKNFFDSTEQYHRKRISIILSTII